MPYTPGLTLSLSAHDPQEVSTKATLLETVLGGGGGEMIPHLLALPGDTFHRLPGLAPTSVGFDS